VVAGVSIGGFSQVKENRMGNLKTLGAIAVAVAIISTPLAATAGKRGWGGSSEPVSSTYETLTQAERDDMAFMREEEKLARDVYLTLHNTWGLNIFSNIADSEQTHTTKVKELLEKYQLPDPVVDDSIGVFVNQDLANLYEAMITRGSVSALEALYVGGAIEETDMIDLQNAIERTDRDDIRQVYENLLAGSRNHLRAYVGQIENQGIVYEAQFLSQEDVDEIVDSPTERGRRR